MGSTSSRPETVSTQRDPSSTQEEKLARYGSQEHRATRLHGMPALADVEHDTSKAQITLSAMKSWDSKALDDPTTRLAAMTLHNAPLQDSLRVRAAETTDQHVFSHVIPEQGSPVTNQKSSGRCWLFATTNVIRVQVIKALNLEQFELSQSYLAFWDKLEKSNTFLENSIELADGPVDHRVFGFLKTAPTNDGGQWDMVTNLIKKYGLVPKAVFPESYNSSNSNQINWLLTLKLREYALELRELKKETQRALKEAGQVDVSLNDARVLRTVRARKDAQMAEVYRIMVIALGVPPQPDKEFAFEYYDKQRKFHRLTSTPLNFLRDYSGSFDPAGACSLINDPRRSYDKLVTVDRLQNVWGGQPVLYVNTTSQQMKDSVVKTIKEGLPVFFGCDVGQFKSGGIMDTAVYDYELAFGIKLGLSKADRIDMGESSMTHAMVITGVHLDEQGKPVRYRVENSWGEDVGDKGFMVMTDRWFDEFVYQVVIRKQHMPAKLWKLFEDGVNEDTDVLPPYDPMGSLASNQGESLTDAIVTAMDGDDDDDAARALPKSTAIASPADADDTDFEVDLILAHQYTPETGELRYLVAWVGYTAEQNSWEPEDGMQNCRSKVRQYWRRNAPGVGPKADEVVAYPAKKRRHWERKDVFGRRRTYGEVMAITDRQRQVQALRHVGKTRQYFVTWEGRIKEITAVRQLNGKPVCRVSFDDGFEFDYSVECAREQCPQALIEYFLKNTPLH